MHTCAFACHCVRKGRYALVWRLFASLRLRLVTTVSLQASCGTHELNEIPTPGPDPVFSWRPTRTQSGDLPGRSIKNPELQKISPGLRARTRIWLICARKIFLAPLLILLGLMCSSAR